MPTAPATRGTAETGPRALEVMVDVTYEAIKRDGHQKNALELMQTRADLYKYLGYHDYENKLDALFAKEKKA